MTISTIEELSRHLNVVWTIGAALFVYLMHAGFGFFEAGMCRNKNTVDTLSHNLITLTIAIIVFWLIGFGIMFGGGNAFLGLSGFAPELSADEAHAYPLLMTRPVPLAVAFAFALSFCDTPATLIAGTGAERIKLAAVTTLTVVISAFIFPIVGHWVIGGGWLSKLGTPVYDIGSGFIHLLGGSCALAVALLLGPRRDRFKRGEPEKQQEKAIAVSSMPLVFLGAFILWMGFFAYSAGFAMTASKSIGLVVANTALADAFGTVTAFGGSWLLTGKAELRATTVALLTTSVAITSPSAVVAPWAAGTIGILAGLATLGSIRFWAWLHIDDPTEFLTMNMVGGLIGMTAVGLFASPVIIEAYHSIPAPVFGLVYGYTEQLLSQCIGAAAIVAFALAFALAGCMILHSIDWLRVSAEEEQEGSDEAIHGEKAEGNDPDENGNGRKGDGDTEDEREPQP